MPPVRRGFTELFHFSCFYTQFPINTGTLKMPILLDADNIFDRELENITFKLQHSCFHFKQKWARIFNSSVSLKHAAAMYVKERKNSRAILSTLLNFSATQILHFKVKID